MQQKDKELLKSIHATGIMRSSSLVKLVLWSPSGKGQISKSIRECIGLSAATLSQVLKELEQAGMVERQYPYRDRRTVKFYLTDKGKEQTELLWRHIKALAELQPRLEKSDAE